MPEIKRIDTIHLENCAYAADPHFQFQDNQFVRIDVLSGDYVCRAEILKTHCISELTAIHEDHADKALLFENIGTLPAESSLMGIFSHPDKERVSQANKEDRTQWYQECLQITKPHFKDSAYLTDDEWLKVHYNKYQKGGVGWQYVPETERGRVAKEYCEYMCSIPPDAYADTVGKISENSIVSCSGYSGFLSISIAKNEEDKVIAVAVRFTEQ